MMGTWGPGVFENDHALDLLSIEVARLVEQIRSVLAIDDLAFSDIEGPLLYVHLLSRLAQEHEVTEITREDVARWKTTYLHAFTSTIGRDHPDYVARRGRVIAREFDTLAARLPDPTLVRWPPKRPAKPAPKKRSKKAPRRRP